MIFEVEIPSIRMKTEDGAKILGRNPKGMRDECEERKSPTNQNKA